MSAPPEDLRAWRKQLRARLIADRRAQPRTEIDAWRLAIDRAIERSFPQLAGQMIGFCWPIQNEYDARHLLHALRRRGAVTALPVVVAPGSPLIFRRWAPGMPLVMGPMDIPYPGDGPAVHPQAMIVPMNGFDRGGYRLGYGAGYFDRTLAACDPRPLTIGVSYELGAVETIHPQFYDIPMDYVVTEKAVYRRAGDRLAQMDS